MLKQTELNVPFPGCVDKDMDQLTCVLPVQLQLNSTTTRLVLINEAQIISR